MSDSISPPVGYRNSASCFVRADVVRRGGRKKEVSEYELFLRLLYLFGGEIRDPGSLKNSRRLRPRVVRGTQTKNFGTYAVMHKRYTITFHFVKNVSSNYRFPDHIDIVGLWCPKPISCGDSDKKEDLIFCPPPLSYCSAPILLVSIEARERTEDHPDKT